MDPSSSALVSSRVLNAALSIRAVLALLIAGAMAVRGYKKNSLDLSGALAAAAVGFASMLSGWRFGLTLILFYASSSALTRVGNKRKAQIESGHKEGGQRDWIQVLVNSGLAVAAALSFLALHGEDVAPPDAQLTQWLLLAHVCFFATCAGDTWSSELGVLSTGAPTLVTTCRRVPAGTNGGVSGLGLLAAAAGGLFVGAVHVLVGALAHGFGAGDGGSVDGPSFSADVFAGSLMREKGVLLLGLVCGLLGSLLDSVLGATCQVTLARRVVGAIRKADQGTGGGKGGSAGRSGLRQRRGSRQDGGGRTADDACKGKEGEDDEQYEGVEQAAAMQVLTGHDMDDHWDDKEGRAVGEAVVVSGTACLSNDGVNFVSAACMMGLGATCGVWLGVGALPVHG